MNLKEGLGLPLAASSSGGSGPAYHADAVHFDEAENLTRAAALTAIDSPIGFYSRWFRLVDPFNSQVIAFKNGDDTLRIQFNASDLQVHAELAEATFTSFLTADTEVDVIPGTDWFHLLIAWNTDFVAGDRLVSVYVSDVLAPVTFGDDDGVAFDVGWAAPINSIECKANLESFDASDGGLWIGSSIVESDGTITEANRRKFITAGLKPTDPSLWPAGAVLDFRGDAASFPTNRGTGGAFTLTGTLTNAADSPSD